jgi:hypothetical protein
MLEMGFGMWPLGVRAYPEGHPEHPPRGVVYLAQGRPRACGEQPLPEARRQSPEHMMSSVLCCRAAA